MAKLKKGDHIYAFNAPVWHHGIYAGRGRVIHFTGNWEDPANARIRFDNLADFSKQKPTVKEYAPGDCFPPDKVVRRAQSRLGQRGYSLTMNNCEQFATWCKTGQHQSTQADVVSTVTGGLSDVVERVVYRASCSCGRTIHGASTVWLCGGCGKHYCTACIKRLRAVRSDASRTVSNVADFFGWKDAVAEVADSLSDRRCRCGHTIDSSQRIRDGVV